MNFATITVSNINRRRRRSGRSLLSAILAKNLYDCTAARYHFASLPYYYYSTKSTTTTITHDHDNGSFDPSRIRNIGIIAHIDAGKTSTTERMLYYAGLTRRIGSVDRGDTVMDHLPQERERGITISAAATTIPWMTSEPHPHPHPHHSHRHRHHRINLIDTPGHVDFTLEVERAMRVMDGCVVIVDGRAGVQAQTRTVWRQADRYGLPRLVFVNKMDREGADYERVLRQLQTEFSITPVSIQWPVGAGHEGCFVAIDDLIQRQRIIWKEGSEGRLMERHPWNDNKAHTERMIEQLAALDENLLEAYLALIDAADGGAFGLHPDTIDAAIKRATQRGAVVPVLCGAATANMGIQPLLDAITRYLPDPSRSMQLVPGLTDHDPLGLAFKVIHDPQRGSGFLVFVRVYAGEFTAGQSLWNSTRTQRERPTRILRVYADRTEETDRLGPGDIGVLLGLRHTCTGDTLHLWQGNSTSSSSVVLPGIPIPSPVFTASLEPEGPAEEDRLNDLLAILTMEDPSIRVTRDPSTGQHLVHGMGELHLQVAHHRLTRELGGKAEMGPVRIAYREAIHNPSSSSSLYYSQEIVYSRESPNGRLTAHLGLILEPMDQDEKDLGEEEEAAPRRRQPISAADIARAVTGGNQGTINDGNYESDQLAVAIDEGIESFLQQGILAGYPMVGVKVGLTSLHWTPGESSYAAFRAAAFELMHRIGVGLVGAGHVRLVEPTGLLRLECPSVYLGTVLQDLHSNRRAMITVDSDDADGDGEGVADEPRDRTIVSAIVPLSEMIGYASALRGLTKGTVASYDLTVKGYQLIQSRQQESAILQAVRGP